MIEILLINNKTNEAIVSHVSPRFLLDTDEESLVTKLTECDCQPVGETNVIECNCDEQWYDYRLSFRALNKE